MSERGGVYIDNDGQDDWAEDEAKISIHLAVR